MTNAVWEVIGGKKDGILVRTGKSIKSDEADSRLGCHSFIEEVELDGERLNYRLLTGTGPDTGWVSLKMKDQNLVVPAKMVVKQGAKEKELLGSLPAPKVWPEALVDKLQAVVEMRLASPDSAPSLQAMGDVVLHLVVDNYMSSETVHIELAGGAGTVRHAREGDKPDFTATTRMATLWKLWAGVLDVESCRKALKLFLVPAPAEDRGPDMDALLTSLLVLEGPASRPADGVRRPVPLERGGCLPPPPQPEDASREPAPDWLLPDGIPEKKRRVLFISIPWSGHIVHLKRIADWFCEHSEYEVHFACLTETAPTLAEGVKVYTAKPSEMTDIFDVMQEKMRVGSMVSSKGKGEEAAAEGITSAESAFDDLDVMLKESSPRLMTFLIRVLLAVRPSIMVSDSCYSMGNLNKFGALFGNARTVFINSPGIKEERMIPSDLAPPAAWVEMMQAANAGKETAEPEKQEELMTSVTAEMWVKGPPTPEDIMKNGGKIDLEMVKPKFRPLFEVPGMNLPMLIRLGDALAKDNPALEPIDIFPSSSWTIEQKPEGKEFFSLPLLPLPVPIGGKLQVGRSALRYCLDEELLDWLFSEDSKAPVVYVAFGTIVKGFKGVIQRIAKALDGGAWRVLWALPKDLQSFLPADLPKDRWRVEGFVNQKDVLRCERVKCFLSHCGMNSTMEAISSGVPMVCHPFFMDQFEWARTVRSHLRAGIEVHKFDSDADAIRGAIQEVLEDPVYRANATAAARRLRAQHESVKRLLGPAMAPRANLGPGSATIAAYILCLLKGKDPSFLYDIVHSPA